MVGIVVYQIVFSSSFAPYCIEALAKPGRGNVLVARYGGESGSGDAAPPVATCGHTNPSRAAGTLPLPCRRICKHLYHKCQVMGRFKIQYRHNSIFSDSCVPWGYRYTPETGFLTDIRQKVGTNSPLAAELRSKPEQSPIRRTSRSSRIRFSVQARRLNRLPNSAFCDRYKGRLIRPCFFLDSPFSRGKDSYLGALIFAIMP